MAKVAIATLKSKFETGDTPTGTDFVDLIDTLNDDISNLKTGAFTNITVSTADPTGGAVGDIWIKKSA
jgi:hypothetical protein